MAELSLLSIFWCPFGLSLRSAELWYCLNCNFCCVWSWFFRSSLTEEKKCVRRLPGKNKWTLAAACRHSMSSWTAGLGFFYSFMLTSPRSLQKTRQQDLLNLSLKLTTVLEMDVDGWWEHLPQEFRAEWKVPNKHFQKCRGWLRIRKAFLDHVLAFKLQGTLAQTENMNILETNQKQSWSVALTPSNPPFPLCLQPQI